MAPLYKKLIIFLCLWSIYLTFSINFTSAFKFSEKRAKQKRDLRSCLQPISGEKVFPTDSEYSDDIVDENTRVTYKPSVIIYVANVKDIQTSIKCAINLKIGIAARSGGHSYENYGLGGRDGVIVVDVKNLNQISINASKKTAVIGAGMRLGPIYNELSKKGFLIPAGSCPSVGITGHALGGGYGFYSRKYGLVSDNLISVDMVKADGSLVTANAKQNSDLFFALRGAGGGSYGIVTSLTFQLSSAPSVVTTFVINYDDLSKVQTVFDAYHKYGKNFPQELTISIGIGKSELQAYGAYLGDSQSAQNALKDFVSATNANPSYTEGSFFGSVVRWSYESPGEVISPPLHPSSSKAKSFFVNSPGLSEQGLQSIVNFVQTMPCQTSALFDLFGGKINSKAPGETAFVHRNTFYGIQLTSSLSAQPEECLSRIKSFGVEFQSKYTSQFSYQNYIDRDLVDWQHKYYGSNFDRLVNIKKKYDPNNVFSFPQSIPVSN